MGTTATDCHLRISALTWNKFSFNLFDYESNDYSRTDLKVDCVGFLKRKGLEIDFGLGVKQKEEVLFRVEEGKMGKYVVDRMGKKENQMGVMRVVKPEEEKMISENELIKIGRVELRIKKLDVNWFPDVRVIIEQCGKAGTGDQCRFCFNQQNQITNPLLSPCKCNGSVKYIHLQCLKTWLNMRVSKQEKGNTLEYHWQNLKCQLCHTNIWSQVDLFSFQQPEQPSIMIQTVHYQESDKKVSIFILPISKNKEKIIKIGRGKDNDIRINDISVSRNHCILTIRQGRGYIQDNGSKFGTLIQFQQPIQLQKQQQVWLQSGMTLIKIATQYQY